MSANPDNEENLANRDSESATPIEPNKRLSDTEPEELAQALRHVFNHGENSSEALSQGDFSRRAAQTSTYSADDCSEAAPLAKARSGYKNPFSLFADVFYGVLVAPQQTLSILSDRSKFPPTAANLLLTLAFVLFTVGLPAAIKALGSADNLDKALAFILGNLTNWSVLSFILYYLGSSMRSHKLTLGNAFIATGWAFLPFAFFAPVACFKGVLGSAFIFLACLPTIWFLALQWIAFRSALRVSNFKLALIALVVPPILCLVYLFWIGMAAFSVISQLLSHLS